MRLALIYSLFATLFSAANSSSNFLFPYEEIIQTGTLKCFGINSGAISVLPERWAQNYSSNLHCLLLNDCLAQRSNCPLNNDIHVAVKRSLNMYRLKKAPEIKDLRLIDKETVFALIVINRKANVTYGQIVKEVTDKLQTAQQQTTLNFQSTFLVGINTCLRAYFVSSDIPKTPAGEGDTIFYQKTTIKSKYCGPKIDYNIVPILAHRAYYKYTALVCQKSHKSEE